MTTVHGRQERSNQISFSAAAAIGGVLIAGVFAVSVHYLNPEFDAITRAMSDYVHGRAGWLMAGSLMSFGLGVFALANAFHRVAASPSEQMGVVLLALSGACAVIAGIFPIDNTADGSFNTGVGAIHAVAGYLLSPLIVTAMLLLSGKIGLGNHHALRRAASLLAVLNGLAFAALLAVNLLMRAPFGGLAQRVFMAMVSGWVVLAAIGLAVDRNK